MRLGVLDVGSNTVHLLVVDAHRGAQPTAMQSLRTLLKMSENLGPDGELTEDGIEDLQAAIGASALAAARAGCTELLAFATSALREAGNCDDVVARIRQTTAVDLQVLTGPDEARITFLAVRRWYGFNAGKLLVLDVGGGSLEIAAGRDEEPQLAVSLPLGAGRLLRDRELNDPPSAAELAATRGWLDAELAEVAQAIKALGPFDLAVGTSKTFRTLSRLTGAAPYSAGPRVLRELTATGLSQVIAFISRMRSTDIGELDGVSAERSGQLTAGALVARAAMVACGIPAVRICPWALREGLILRRLDELALRP